LVPGSHKPGTEVIASCLYAALPKAHGVPSQVKVVRPGNNVLNLCVRPYSRVIVIGTVPVLLQRYEFLGNSGERIGRLLIVR